MYIYIYDSLNSKKLYEHHKQFLTRLFPTYNFEKCRVKFPTVQRQPNCNDCGVFAITFAISLQILQRNIMRNKNNVKIMTM